MAERLGQYVSIHYTERLVEAGSDPSVGSVGDSHDNGPAETGIGLFKTKIICRRGPGRTAAAVKSVILDWVAWFNHRRVLKPSGNSPPAEAETRYYAQTISQAMAA